MMTLDMGGFLSSSLSHSDRTGNRDRESPRAGRGGAGANARGPKNRD